MTEYFKRSRERDRDWNTGQRVTHFSYRALGSPRYSPDWHREVRPTVELEGRHLHESFIPTFDNTVEPGSGNYSDEWGHTGLNTTYLSNKLKALTEKEETGSLSSQSEISALKALRHISVAGRSQEGSEEHKWAVDQVANNPHIAPTTLFETDTPAKTQITYMVSDPSLVQSTMTLAGLAYDDYNRAPIQADYDLSEHSSKLVKNAMEKGLPVTTDPRNKNANVLNNYSLEPRETVNPESFVYNYTPLTTQDIARGRGAVREIVGKERKRNTKPVTAKGLSDQFLPGMEGFV